MKSCGGLIEAIEDIGSTAIAGIKANDVIDIQCGVIDFSQEKILIRKLNELGFVQLRHIKQDHVPFRDANFFEKGWEKLFFKGSIQAIACNIHVRILGNPNWCFALQFRDYLNEHQNIAFAYEEIKLRLANSGIDKDHYCYVKDPVCDLIYQLVKLEAKVVGYS